MAQGIQPASASQHLGLSASGARGPTPQVAVAYPLEWTSNSPGSNLEGGLGGGRSMTNTGEYLELSAMTSLPNWQAT